jgi:hypothetical protein
MMKNPLSYFEMVLCLLKKRVTPVLEPVGEGPRGVRGVFLQGEFSPCRIDGKSLMIGFTPTS